MKLTTLIFGLFVAVAVAAPAANPEANPVAVTNPEDIPEAGVDLAKRQNCGQCVGGTRNCCGVGGCMLFKC